MPSNKLTIDFNVEFSTPCEVIHIFTDGEYDKIWFRLAELQRRF